MAKKKTETETETKIVGAHKVEEAILIMIDQRISESLKNISEAGVLPEGDGVPVLDAELIKNILVIVQGELQDFDFSDEVSDAINNVDMEDHIDNVVDSYYIRDRIDMSDVASDVMDYIDITDYIDVANDIQEFIDSGCSTVDDYCKKIVERGTGGDNSDFVTLSGDEYTRIMEVVNFIKPEQAPEPTPQDLANQLIALVQPGDAIELVTTATIEKAQADAQAIVDAAVGKVAEDD